MSLNNIFICKGLISHCLDTYKNVIDTIVLFSDTTLTGCAKCSSDAVCTICHSGQYLDGVACKG